MVSEGNRIPAVSPCFGEGSGLKQHERITSEYDQKVSPCFGEGSGLKLDARLDERRRERVSPCFGEGSGLKRLKRQKRLK